MRVSTLMLASVAALGAALMSAGPAWALAARPTTELNVRVGPSTDTAIVHTLSAGELIEIVSCGSGWCKLSSGGFVSEAYLVAPGPAAPAAVPAPATYPGVPMPPSSYRVPEPTAPAGFYGSVAPAAYDRAQPATYPASWYGGSAEAGGARYPASWYGADSPDGPDSWYGGGDRWADDSGAYGGYGGYGGYDQGWEFTDSDPWPRRTRVEFNIASEPDSFPFAFGIESTVRPPACFYDRPGYRGDGFCRFAQVSAPHMLRRWDDRIGSIYVHPGYAVEVCTGENFTGYCRTLTSSDNWVGRALDDNISSYRVYRR